MSSRFACIGTAKSTKKSCHLLYHVTRISAFSGPSTSTGAGEVHEVCVEVHRENVEEEGRHNLDLIYLFLTPVPVDIEGLLNAEIQATWFSKWQLFFVDLAVPMQVNFEDTVEDDDALYQKLISQSMDAETSRPESTSSTASGSKVNVPAAAQQNVQVVN